MKLNIHFLMAFKIFNLHLQFSKFAIAVNHMTKYLFNQLQCKFKRNIFSKMKFKKTQRKWALKTDIRQKRWHIKKAEKL